MIEKNIYELNEAQDIKELLLIKEALKSFSANGKYRIIKSLKINDIKKGFLSKLNKKV